MEISRAKITLSLLLEGQWHLCGPFCRFLDESGYEFMDKEEWINVWQFYHTIDADLSNYNADGDCKIIESI